MRVNAMLNTHDLPEETLPWMAEVREVFDELVIFIDEKRVTPGTVARARKVGTRVYSHVTETMFRWDLAAMMRTCECDWVFRLDYDEQLSSEWQQGQWRQILETTSFTNFWVPRRWMVSMDRYIASNPWCPDFQLRFFRKNLEGTIFPTKLHDSAIVSSSGACFQNLAINHHALWLSSRAAREDKVRLYEEFEPGGSGRHYYLFEDHAPREAKLPEPVALDPSREILPMVKLSPEKITGVSLKVESVPQAVGVSELFWLDAEVTNETAETLHSRPPLSPVHLSYHWLDQVDRRICVWDGCRSGFYPDATAYTTTPCTMMIVAPFRPGRYLLQISIVQEEVCWFDQVRPDILQEFDVSVTTR